MRLKRSLWEGTVFERNRAKKTASEVLTHSRPYLELLAQDKQLQKRLIAALAAGAAVRRRMTSQIGSAGTARQLVTDSVLRGQIVEVVSELRQVEARLRRKRLGQIVRNWMLVLAGAGVLSVALAKLRVRMTNERRGDQGEDADARSSDQNPAVVQYIDVDVPVSTAYNQWTQFEEFPRFMEGVDEVKQLDDTLLHWAVTVAGRRAEWDAKITQQEPDRSIAWESVDGRHVRGVVTFEAIDGQAARTRIRLAMSYAVDGPAEKAGAALGLDDRRVRGDLERFRDLIESRQGESGEEKLGRPTAVAADRKAGKTVPADV
jgi:uncharacterized membrane protein